jgi:hypothetical protein
MWREHAGLSVTDGSQKQAMMPPVCSAFMFGARPNVVAGHFMMPRHRRYEAKAAIPTAIRFLPGVVKRNFPAISAM